MTKRIKPEKPLRESLASHRSEPEEEVRTLTAKVQTFVEGREVLLFSILAVAVLVAGGLGVMWFLKSNEETLAADRLGVAYAGYRATLFGDPLNPAPQPPQWVPRDVAEDAGAMAALAGEHGRSRAGRMARYLAGNAYLRAGDPGKAIPLLEAAVAELPEPGEMRNYALDALASAYEDQEAPEKALEAYARLATSETPRFKLDGLLGRGRALWALGRKEEAMAAFTQAQTEFPQMAQAPPADLDVVVRDGARKTSGEK
ncbi:MAG: tetratricopeptide repeat protein [Myxococcota bacterium]